MIKRRLEDFLENRRATLLGVGPMSKNCVDATIELANTYEVPIMMIASRRQIDSEDFGGGYVNNWSTERFADYVTDQDKKGKIILARDHGGPWQSEIEKKEKMSLRRAMMSAKSSYKSDIEAGFEVIHIDPSVDIFGSPSVDDVLDRIFELYEFCWEVAQKSNRTITFEVGTEEQSGSTNTTDKLQYVLERIFKFCGKNKLPTPSFVVIQTGTRVMEMRNVGTFDSPIRIAGELPAEIQVPKMINMCQKFNIFMKEHNTDYLSTEALQWHPKLGIHSANVAPEFGVSESQAFLNVLIENNMGALADQFIQVAYDSRKWEKWMLPDTKAGKKEMALIAGHYTFSTPEFIEIKKMAQSHLIKKGIDLDEVLKNCVKTSILRYLTSFRLVRAF